MMRNSGRPRFPSKLGKFKQAKNRKDKGLRESDKSGRAEWKARGEKSELEYLRDNRERLGEREREVKQIKKEAKKELAEGATE